MLRLPRNSNLAKPSRDRANGPVSEPVPRPFRDRSETVPRPFRDRRRTGVAAEVVCALSGSPIHAQRERFLHLAIPQLAESGRSTLRKCCACHEKSILDLAKVLRLPRNLYLTLRKCCACHAIQTLRSHRAAVPMGPSPNPFRDRSETVPRPFPASLQASQPRWFAHCPEAQFTHSANVFCILPSPSSQRVDAAPCESAAPATKSILDLAKVLRLPRNLYLTLRKCCACHAIQSLRNLRAAVPMGPSPNPFRDRSETVPRPPPYRRRSRGGLRTVQKPNSRTAPTFSASCHPPARRECLRKCCACHEIYT